MSNTIADAVAEEKARLEALGDGPEFKRDAFECPHAACGAYSQQGWMRVFVQREGTAGTHPLEPEMLMAAFCQRCGDYSLWRDGEMIWPEYSPAPAPNPDLNEDIRRDFEEARSIVSRSTRGAGMLLRLCIAKLCVQLGESGKNLNQDIGNLVKNGLPETIQMSLDIVRVTVNEGAAHAGLMDMSDDLETAMTLFDLVNLIAETMISEPNRIKAVYQSLPETKRKQIEERKARAK
ncbi:MAG: DUF4145 domain-containing protein [Planctomycetes bacterium]|nr:DUF4145 domain-containing protein [Planctomycetota bacterium]